MRLIITIIGLGFIVLLIVAALYTAFGVRQTEHRLPPLGQFIEVDGSKLHYLDQGSGEVLLLIHGANTNLLDFNASILPILAKKYRVIAFDRPGFGYSERPSGQWPDPARLAQLFAHALTQLGIEQAVWLGYSWSGSVVLAALLEQPERVNAAVLLAAASHPWQGGVEWTKRITGIPLLGELFAYTLVYPAGQLLLDSALKDSFVPNSVPPDYLERTGVTLALRPQTFLANGEDLRKLSDFLQQQSQRYQEIDRPMLMITGTADDVVPAWNHAERLHRLHPDSRWLTLEDTGHVLHHIHTERISDLISQFIEDLR